MTLSVTGMVHGTGGGVYSIVLDDGTRIDASIRGRLKREVRTGDRVVVGDRVEVAPGEPGSWTIEAVLERHTQIVRASGPAGRPKVVAANLDRLLVVLAAGEPEPRAEVADRLLALAEADGVEAALVMNKMDAPGAEETAAWWRATYPPLGYPVIPVSAAEGTGLDDLRSLLCSGLSALVGPSGVGKSSLLNAIEPGLDLRIGALSKKVGRGRHTTVSSRLISLGCGGLVADTPGFAEVGIWGVDPARVGELFPEIRQRTDACRFRGCAHVKEPDCAVLDALKNGDIEPSRYASYRTLRAEADEAAARH